MKNLSFPKRVELQHDAALLVSDFGSPAQLPYPELEWAARIVAQQSRARAMLALLGDKQFLFSSSGKSFLMYATCGRCHVAMGDPVGPVSEWRELIAAFCSMSRKTGGWPVFYQVEPEALQAYRDQGLNSMKLGEEAWVSLPDFSMGGSKRSRLRQTLRRTERGGGSLEILDQVPNAGLMAELRRVSDAWLEKKNTREKGFSLGAFYPEYLSRCPLAIVRQDERIVAFANLWCGQYGSELGLDLMRYTPDAPYGVMEYLFVKLFEWGKAQGYSRFNLGMAPLAGLDTEAPNSFWARAGSTVYKHGEYFYNFKGVREYKAKFLPKWESRYLVSPRGVRLPFSIAAVSSLIAGGAMGMVSR